MIIARTLNWYCVLNMLELFASQLEMPTIKELFLQVVSKPNEVYGESSIEAVIIGRILTLHISQLDITTIKNAHVHAIQTGQVRSLILFKALSAEYQPDIADIAKALENAARAKKYGVVLERIESIPNERLSILKAESESKNILHWAIGRRVKKDIETILYALVPADRFRLITEHSNDSVGSPLTYASRNGWTDNIKTVLASLSEEARFSAILPRKVSLNTPFYNAHPDSISLFLGYLFGDNHLLYNAYYDLDVRCNVSSIKQLRDFYLLNHHSHGQTFKRIPFFSSTFSIPGHSLSKEELDLVARVVFYKQYRKLDYLQRGKIEAQMENNDNPQSRGCFKCF